MQRAQRRRLQHLVILAILWLLAPVAPATSKGRSPDLDQLAAAFRGRVAKLPPSAYSQSCPHPFADGLLDEYLSAISKGDVQGALAILWKLDVQLGCVSAARFAGVHAAFREEVLADAAADDAPMLSPVVLLFLEYGGGPFRAELLAWLDDHLRALVAALADSSSRLAELGLLLRDRDGLVRVTGAPAQRLLAEVSGDGLDSGRCTLLELEELGGAGGRSVYFCPKDCQELLLSGDDEAQGRLAGFVPSDVEAECERRRDEKDRLRRSKTGWGIAQCVEEFSETQPSMLACQVEGLQGYRAARLQVGQPEPTNEDIYARRACMISQRKSYADYLRLFEAEAYVRDVYRERESLFRTRDRLIQLIRDNFDPDFEPGPVDFSGDGLPAESDCPGCDDEERLRHENLLKGFDSNESRLIENHADLHEALDLYQDAYERLVPAGDCEADGTGCSDTCGIEDALAAMAEGCVDEATSREAPALGGRPAPRPEISTPDPRGPGLLPEGLTGLQQCLSNVTGGGGPQGDAACYDRTCPDGKVPTVAPDEPSGCTCVEPEERQRSLDFCPGYLDCPSDPATACECVALRDPGESIGGGGPGPGRPPGLGGPERGPFRLPAD